MLRRRALVFVWGASGLVAVGCVERAPVVTAGTALDAEPNTGADALDGDAGTTLDDVLGADADPDLAVRELPDMRGGSDALVLQTEAGAGGRPENARIVFVTSTRYSGALGGLLGADAHCLARAQAAGLPGTFKAWLSTATVSAASRLVHHDGPYIRLDGAVIANSWTDLTDGTLAVPILVDERGTRVAVDAWTGTEPSGEPHMGQDCSGFTSAAFDETGLCGANTAADGRWTSNLTPGCGTALSLYCVEQ